ncbi:MAG TPA: hypothetical protein VGE74_09120 [Gemmata sp.]
MSNLSRPPGARSARLSVENLEDRTTPTFLSRPGNVIGINTVNVPAGGLSLAAGNVLPDPSTGGGRVQNEYVTGTGPGTEGTVRVWRLNGQTNGQSVPALTIDPFPGFQGGINVAVGDVTGDGAAEIIAAVAGNGPPHVKVFDNTGALLGSFLAFDPAFQGGVNIAVGNVLGGIGGGGFAGGTVSQNFKQEIIIGAASGGAPHVVVTNAAGTVLRSFLAFDLGYRGGVSVAAGSINTTRNANYNFTGVDTNAYDEIIVGSASGGAHVKAFEVWTGAITERLSFLAFDPATAQGVTVAAGSTDGNRGAEIYVGQILPTNAGASSTVRVFNGSGQALLDAVPYPATYSRVVNMVVGNLFGNYDPSDDDSTFFGSNRDFVTQDFAVVAGDGSYFQQPRFYFGFGFGSPAGAYGP